MKAQFVCLTIAVVSVGALPLLAHHSFDAQFNAARPMNLNGEITGVDWTVPHSYLWLSVRERSGAVRHWHGEGGPSNFLTQAGWTREMLATLIKSHATVTASGFESKRGPRPDDSGQPLTVTGNVTALDWTNPFSWLSVEARNRATNTAANYRFALGHLSDLVANGWARDSVGKGMTVTVMGIMMKDQASQGNALTVTLAGGQVLKAAADYMLPPGSERSPNAWIREIELPDGRKLPFSKDPQ